MAKPRKVTKGKKLPKPPAKKRDKSKTTARRSRTVTAGEALEQGIAHPAELPIAVGESAPVAVAPVVKDYDSDSNHILEAIRKQQFVVKRAEVDVAERASDLKAAKGELAGAEKKLRSLIENDEPLFQAAAQNGKVATTESDQRYRDCDDAWRPVKLADLPGLTVGDVTNLGCVDVNTLGELADWTAQGHNRLDQIKGIGEAAANRIEDAVAAYWGRRKKEVLDEVATKFEVHTLGCG